MRDLEPVHILSKRLPANVEQCVWIHVEEDGKQLLIRETVEARQVVVSRILTEVDLQSS